MESEDQVSLLTEALREFADERDWNQFHTPKNLAMALSVEASELVEIFQWLTPEESCDLPPAKLKQAREELADVFIYLIRTADRLSIDIVEAAWEKHRDNKAKYPADKVRGSAAKYTEHQIDE